MWQEILIEIYHVAVIIIAVALVAGLGFGLFFWWWLYSLVDADAEYVAGYTAACPHDRLEMTATGYRCKECTYEYFDGHP